MAAELSEDASKAARGLIRREGPIGWLLVAQTTFMLLVLTGFGLLLYELRDVNLASRDMQADLYQQLLTISTESIQQEANARREMVAIAEQGRRTNAQTAAAIQLLSDAIKDRRTFDQLVFDEMKRGTETMRSSEQVLKRLLEKVPVER